jgi:ketosteroid isomerase-like protein
MHPNQDNQELIEVVRELLRCENGADADRAGQILSEGFLGLTRAKGVERTRVELLDDIAHPKNPDIERELEAGTSSVRVAPDLAVTRTVVVTGNRRDAAAPHQRFRNTHVFEREGGVWRCVAWQVTELK